MRKGRNRECKSTLTGFEAVIEVMGRMKEKKSETLPFFYFSLCGLGMLWYFVSECGS